MHPYRGPVFLAILIITVGVGWLMTVQNIVPGMNWVWTLGLLLTGVLTFVFNRGINKFSVVAGPFFVIASLLSTLRQTGRLALETELPILVILVGVLLLVSQIPGIPIPDWAVSRADSPGRESGTSRKL